MDFSPLNLYNCPLGRDLCCESLWEDLEHTAEKAMAPHSSTLAWKIPWTAEPGRLQSMGSQSQTWLSNFTFTFNFYALEKEMATHSSVLAWSIQGSGEPGGLPSMWSHRVGHDWSDLAAAAVLGFILGGSNLLGLGLTLSDVLIC